MYEFETYDPDRPRMVTSFKGNQKLIFQGYRYNIHHVVPAKGLKTWRCVCAKKLTSARSWCKGRAETWENDSKGIAKGEHNHPAEHEIAEQEYFKSQLILAAIANPNAALSDLIKEAGTFMSPGVQFSSSDSLKKSLMQARKSAENGVFKLKNYKNSDPTRNNNNNSTTSNRNGHHHHNHHQQRQQQQQQQHQQQQQQQQLQQQLSAAQNLLSQQHHQNQQTQQQQNSNALKMPEKLKDFVDLKMFEQNGTMFSLISLAQQHQQRQLLQQQNEPNNNVSGKGGAKNNSNAAAAAAAAAAALLFNNNNNNNNGADGSYGDSDASNDMNMFGASTMTSSASTLLSQFVTTTAANYGSNGASANASPSHAHGAAANNSSVIAGPPPAPSTFSDCSAVAADFLLNSGFEMMMEGTTPKFPRLDSSRLRQIGAGSPARSSSGSAAFNDSGIGMSPPSALFHHGPGRRRKNAASANFDVMSTLQSHGHSSSDSFQTPARSNTPLGGLNNSIQHSLIQQQQKKKMARINNIFDKLSHKAAVAASSSSSASNGTGTHANQYSGFTLPFNHGVNANGNTSNSSQRNSPFSTASSGGGGTFEDSMSRGSTIFPNSIVGFASAAPPKHVQSIETQTDDSFLSDLYGEKSEDSSVRLSSCIGRSLDNSNCTCRVITVCCCSEETCKRRKMAAAGVTPSTSPPSTPASDSFDTELATSPKPFDASTSYDIKQNDALINDDSVVEKHNNDDDEENDVNAADDADIDVVGASMTPPPTAASLLDDKATASAVVESVTKTLEEAVNSMEKEKDDSDDAVSLELNLSAVKMEHGRE